MDAVDPAHGILVTAQGMLIYLQPHDGIGLTQLPPGE
jgi:hypothetical protein